MSKYTTEVRFICESKSGLENSAGADNVDDIISKSWDKIFTKKAVFFDEEYRSILCQKILKHYYLREICCETVGIWKLWMNTRLEEVMPYYNQLYESAKIKFDPMHNTKLTTTHDKKQNRDSTGDSSFNSSQNTLQNRNNTNNNIKKDLYSETPQGALTGIETETYLTDARKITDNASENEENTSKVTTDNTNNYNDNENSSENYNETITGKSSGESFSEMLIKFRETFMNIDMMVIDEFSDLFFNIW